MDGDEPIVASVAFGAAGIEDRMKVFVSYSRDDVDFADQLVLALEDRGFQPILDRHSIDAAENWRERLGALILSADAVAFLLTERSAASPVCLWEVEEAKRLGKRMIPILPRELNGVKPPETLADLNYIHFYREAAIPGSGVYQGLRKLEHALRTDLSWLRTQTRFSERAADWNKRGRAEDGALLLLGSTLTEARDWVSRKPRDAGIPALVADYISASEAAEARRTAEATAQIAEREKTLQTAEAAVKQAAEAQAARTRAQGRFRNLAIFSLAAGLILMAGALWASWIAATNYAESKAQTASVFALASTKLANEGRNAEAMLMALYGDPAAAADPVQQFFHKTGYEPARNALSRAYTDNQLEGIFRVPTTYMRSAIWTPDGQHILTGLSDEKIRLWDLHGKQVGILEGLGNFPINLAISPDGKFVLAKAYDTGKTMLWSIDGQPVQTLSTNQYIGAFVFLGDGRIATKSDAVVTIWTSSGAPIKSFDTGEEITCLSTTPDGQSLLLASQSKSYVASVSVWSTDGQRLQTIPAVDLSLNTIAMSRAGDAIFGVSDNGAVVSWRYLKEAAVKPGAKAPSVENGLVQFKGHKLSPRSFDLSPDSRFVLTGSNDDTAVLYDRRGNILRTVEIPGSNVADTRFSPDGKHFLTASNDGAIRIWRTESVPLQTYKEPGEIDTLSFSPDGKNFFAGLDGIGLDPTVRAEVRSLDGTSRQAFAGPMQMTGIFSADGKQVHVRSGYYDVQTFNVGPNGKPASKTSLGSGGDRFFMPADRSMFFTTATEYAAADPKNPEAPRRLQHFGKLLSLDGKLLAETTHLDPLIHTASITPDGKRLLISSSDNQIRGYSPDGKEVFALPKMEAGAYHLAVSQDSSRFVAGLVDYTARIWTIEGKPVSTLSGHRDEITDVVFSPDGSMIATSSLDKTVRLWSVSNGDLLAIYSGYADVIFAVAFSPDSRSLLVGTKTGAVDLWALPEMLQLSAKDQVRRACDALQAIGMTELPAVIRQEYHILDGLPASPCPAAP